MTVISEININRCPLNFNVPCNPGNCQEQCDFKETIKEAGRNPECQRCWIVDGNQPIYMQDGAIYYPDLRGGIRCPKSNCKTAEISRIRAELTAMTEAKETKKNGHQNGKRLGI